MVSFCKSTLSCVFRLFSLSPTSFLLSLIKEIKLKGFKKGVETRKITTAVMPVTQVVVTQVRWHWAQKSQVGGMLRRCRLCKPSSSLISYLLSCLFFFSLQHCLTSQIFYHFFLLFFFFHLLEHKLQKDRDYCLFPHFLLSSHCLESQCTLVDQ